MVQYSNAMTNLVNYDLKIKSKQQCGSTYNIKTNFMFFFFSGASLKTFPLTVYLKSREANLCQKGEKKDEK